MSATQSPGALSARQVTKNYGHYPALAGVDLEVRQGAWLTLFGRNGAGKTTFLKIAATLARPSSGALAIGGFDVAREPEAVRRYVGFLSHNTYVYRDLTPLENLRFFSRLYGLDRTDRELIPLLERVGLSDRLNETVRSFSRGLLQRVGIARVMLHDPPLLLLDEPYTGLDAGAVAILNTMLDEAVSSGRTVILTTHDVELGLRAASDVAIIHRGRIVRRGAPDSAIRQAYREFIVTGAEG